MPVTHYRTRLLGNIVTLAGEPDDRGYVATASVLTGRPYGHLRFAGLTPATAEEIEHAEAECRKLANSPDPGHDCELARARTAARRRLGMEP